MGAQAETREPMRQPTEAEVELQRRLHIENQRRCSLIDYARVVVATRIGTPGHEAAVQKLHACVLAGGYYDESRLA